MNTVILVSLSLWLSQTTMADPYDALDAANSKLRARVMDRESFVKTLPPGEAKALELQNAFDRQALDANENATKAVREPARGAFDGATLSALTLANQTQINATANANSKRNSGGGDSKQPASPNPAFQVQTLQVPDAKFDTSIKDDKAPLLGELQKQVSDLEKTLAEPVIPQDLSVEQSVEKEIADIKKASETEVMLLKAQAAFVVHAEKERGKKSAVSQKTIEDELKDLEKGSDSGSPLADAVKKADDTPRPQPNPNTNDLPRSGGHVDTLTGNPPPSVTSLRRSRQTE
jgi:hypothetical protein